MSETSKRPRSSAHVCVIDNYDSFTFNITQYLAQLGARVTVYRNDAVTVAELLPRLRRAADAASPDSNPADFTHLLLSPGPGAPADAGICVELLKAARGRVPIFGVCLGMQALYESEGGVVAEASEVRHGKTSPITHDGKGVFKGECLLLRSGCVLHREHERAAVRAGLPSPLTAVRYHSLAGVRDTLPPTLEITCESPGGIIQGVRVRLCACMCEGVQFHPESILTEHGHDMLGNFLDAE